MNSTVLLIGICCVALSYFIGNISPAILIGRLHGIDIKKEGSGNAGTTNVLRVLGKKAAVATLVIDILKGAIAVWIGVGAGLLLAPDYTVMFQLVCGLAVIWGHIWPVVFRFKGGKGVATAFGVIVAINPFVGLTILLIVLIIVALTRRVSAGSVIGAALFPAVAYFLNQPVAVANSPYYMLWSVLLAAIILLKHRENIKRLLKGQEPKLSFKK